MHRESGCADWRVRFLACVEQKKEKLPTFVVYSSTCINLRLTEKGSSLSGYLQFIQVPDGRPTRIKELEG